MPNGKRNGRGRKRKTGPRRGRRAGIPTTIQIVPPAFRRVFLGYKYLGTMTEPAASTGAIQQFRLNSLYDPDFTNVGTTALGYTALTGVYGLFRVVRCRVVARFVLSTTGTASVGMLPGLNSTVSSTYHFLEAEPNACSKMIQGNVGGGHSLAEFNKVYNMAKVSGITKRQYDTDFDFAHSTGANPAKPVYLTAFIAGNSAAVQTVILNVRLIFEVECSQPLQSVTA